MGEIFQLAKKVQKRLGKTNPAIRRIAASSKFELSFKTILKQRRNRESRTCVSIL